MNYNLEDWSDEELMVNVAKGYKSSYSIIVDRYLNKAISYTRKLSPEDFEDIVQLTFFKIWQRAKYYNVDKAKFSTWFYRILQNQAYDFLRKKKREREFTEEYQKELIISDVINLEEKLLKEKDNKDLIYLIIKELKNREQKVVILRYLEDMSIKECSNIMKCSEKAIEALLTRSKKKMISSIKK